MEAILTIVVIVVILSKILNPEDNNQNINDFDI